MKGFLFFAGSLIQWPPKRPNQFLFFHAYILLIYACTYLAQLASFNGSGFIFSVGMLGPLFYAIFRGLPLDCLDYKSAIQREFNTELSK